jgi:uncharacterized protein (TIGR00375 family)
LDLQNIDLWCRKKGINICGTGDFTHPKWLSEIKEKLVEAGNGLLALKNQEEKIPQPPLTRGQEKIPSASFIKGGNMVYFILTTEISCIYKQGGKTRRIHLILFAPTIEVVEKINQELEKRGCNLKSDGRPIVGLSAKEVAKIVFAASRDCMVIPAHAWTPWFSVFGSKSGFDTIEECFEELAPQIFAIETGLSSDPAMNWRLSKLDKITLISNSDAHSPENLGREANVLEIVDSKNLYQDIVRILKEKDNKQFLYTIEFFPEEGKYHFDGHATCKISLSPEETKKNKGICPTCRKPLVIGVLNRVEELADRPEGEQPANLIPYKSLVPLREIIAEAMDQGRATKRVVAEYDKLIARGESEFNILLNLDYEDLKKITLSEIVEGIKRVREGKLIIAPGYDGVYGTVKIFSEQEKKKNRQERLL